ncbi:unnamed protein product [Fraxinus pennsylvanica]|uniref:PAZ domain-containing protein n=1 Tax=Fraxinus pennsylvanica TaxID=56036 RepID=A0AAD2DPD1_9LAMI|nr:unnamed protein product [Fraxinus pennsylvanica]
MAKKKTVYGTRSTVTGTDTDLYTLSMEDVKELSFILGISLPLLLSRIHCPAKANYAWKWFSLKQKIKDDAGEFQTAKLTVYDFFTDNRNIDLPYIADLPCINVRNPKRPAYFPIELCSLVYSHARPFLQQI